MLHSVFQESGFSLLRCCGLLRCIYKAVVSNGLKNILPATMHISRIVAVCCVLRYIFISQQYATFCNNGFLAVLRASNTCHYCIYYFSQQYVTYIY